VIISNLEMVLALLKARLTIHERSLMTYLSNTLILILQITPLTFCLITTGCSASKTSVPLPFTYQASEKWLASPSGSEDSHVIELKARDSSNKLHGYATAFKTCGYSAKTSLRGASRQFFIGLEKLQIQSQGPAEVPPYQLWKVEADALNEGFPIWLTSYTMRKDECFIDFALWVPKPAENGATANFDKELNELREHFFSLLGQMITDI
jgi:hypothetical protein